jgi:hypothetical protein
MSAKINSDICLRLLDKYKRNSVREVGMRAPCENDNFEGASCEELLHTFTTKICTHNKNPVGSGTTM